MQSYIEPLNHHVKTRTESSLPHLRTSPFPFLPLTLLFSASIFPTTFRHPRTDTACTCIKTLFELVRDAQASSFFVLKADVSQIERR